jgi:hypothetical protein
MTKPVVFGGNVNGTLKTWLQQLGVVDFLHAAVLVKSIDPADIQLSAEHVRKTYGHADFIFTVGTFAHKTLTLAGMDHGALPPTNTKNLKQIDAALNQCRNYLIRSMYYAPKSSPIISS